MCHIRSDIPLVRLRNREINERGFESLILEVTVGESVTVFVFVAFYKHPFLSDTLFKEYFGKIADILLSSYNDIVFFLLAMGTVALEDVLLLVIYVNCMDLRI